MELSADILRIIEEEEANLLHLQSNYITHLRDNLRQDILQQIVNLNEAIPDVNSDELPQLRDQLLRLDALLQQIDKRDTDPLDLMNPYFGHMRLDDRTGMKDLFLGSQVFRTTDGSIQIIDWKTSPIALIYFMYNEGDDYEEEIGDRLFEGEVIFKRILRIVDGKLIQIQSGDIMLSRDENDDWKRVEYRQLLLKGGAGVATRPENTVTINPQMGFGRQGEIRKNKLLPEITALIDPSQFELITMPETSVVAIQGTAGSGKTTVALHRVAWLHFQDRERFIPESMLIMVFNKALSNYISRVLPSLGVDDIIIDYFEQWAGMQRNRLFSGNVPEGCLETTPVSVIRFKKHPLLLALINEFIERKNSEFNERLADIIARADSNRKALLNELTALPLISRAFTLHEWVTGKRMVQNQSFDLGVESESLLQHLVEEFIDPEESRIRMLLSYWEELFTDFEYLKEGFLEHSDDLSEHQLDEVIEWLKWQNTELNSVQADYKKDLTDIMSEEGKGSSRPAVLDYEDDAILLYLYQKLFKEITTSKRKKLQFSHVMVDEVQDFSPIELAVLVNVAKKPHSLTFAGDVNQKMIKHSGFITWEKTFASLGIEGQTVSPLKIGYRSTYEIMEFSLELLGDLAENKEFIATRHGPPVELFQFSSQGELIQKLYQSLVELTTYEPIASVALICPDLDSASVYYQHLDKMGLSGLRFIADQDFPFVPGIDVTDVRQVKGLEFDYVVLLDADKQNYKTDSYSRYLLHIASSRAAHQLWIMVHRQPSGVLPSSLLERSLL